MSERVEFAPNSYLCRESVRVTFFQELTERWCFGCRQRTIPVYEVLTPADPMSYYGPTPRVSCTVCNRTDGDLFPGTSREWSDE